MQQQRQGVAIVDVVENGFVVYYHRPVKAETSPLPQGYDHISAMFEGALKKGREAMGESESWKGDDAVPPHLAPVAGAVEALRASKALAPERYTLEERAVFCPTADHVAAVVSDAKEAHALALTLQRKGLLATSALVMPFSLVGY